MDIRKTIFFWSAGSAWSARSAKFRCGPPLYSAAMHHLTMSEDTVFEHDWENDRDYDREQDHDCDREQDHRDIDRAEDHDYD